MRLVNGVAGSGKTLIAVHRARLFAERCARDRVLLLIHDKRAGRRLPPNVFLGTFFGWVTEPWAARFGERPRMSGKRALRELIRDSRARVAGLKLSDEQGADELDFINETWVRDEAGDLAVQRVGRGFPLKQRESERPQLWHVSIDEAQFFAPSGFQVIKRSLQPEGQLFLCADPNQGFLEHRLNGKSSGLDVAGRTKRLRRS